MIAGARIRTQWAAKSFFSGNFREALAETGEIHQESRDEADWKNLSVATLPRLVA